MRTTKEVRNCMTCDSCMIGCENDCPFEIEEGIEKGQTLLKKRKAMKAERAKAVAKAEILSCSARKNKGQKNLYDKPKRSYIHSDKNLKKQKERRAKRISKNSKK